MKTGNTAYKSGVALALATPFLLVWMIGAVGILGREGDRADLMYIGVFAVGSIGAITARFRPHGITRALFAAALAQALVGEMHQDPHSSVGEILGFNGFFVALFLGSAWHFRNAARALGRNSTLSA